MRRAFGRLSAGVLLVASLVGALPSLYLGIVTCFALPRGRQRRRRGPGTGDTVFAILVPAHDEAAGIAETLASFSSLDYPKDRFSVHVVADNCIDDTAKVVRAHGWVAHERNIPDLPGKGPALNWLRDRLVEQGVPFDAVVIVDADSTLDRGFLAEMNDVFQAGWDAAQGFYSVRDPDATPLTGARYAALACRHHLRPLGRTRMGGSCGLYGNGMAFRRQLVLDRDWSGHLVEDAEYQIELLLDGHIVHYAPGAVLWAEMPEEVGQATSQNERWERGRIDLVRRYVPVLFDRLVSGRGRRVALGDALADQLVPPLSVLVAFQGAVTGVALVGTLTGSRNARRSLVIESTALFGVVCHVVAGLYSVQAPRRVLRSILSVPRLILWKSALWVSVLGRDSDAVPWARTDRNVDRIAEDINQERRSRVDRGAAAPPGTDT